MVTSGGRFFLSSARRSFTALATGDGIGAVLLFDANADGRGTPLMTAMWRMSSRPSSTRGDVLDADVGIVDGLAAALLDLDVADFLGRDAFAHGADVEFVLRILEVTGGFLDLLGLKRGLDVEHGKLKRLELVVVHPDAEVALLVAGEGDFADAGQDFQLIDDVELEEFGQRVEVAFGGGSAKEDDGLVPRDCF